MLIKFDNNTINDFEINSYNHSIVDNNHQYEFCTYDKQHHASFKSIKRHRNKSLELIHFNLCKMNIISLRNDKYILTFIDDCIRYDHVMLLSNKNATIILAAFKDYQA